MDGNMNVQGTGPSQGTTPQNVPSAPPTPPTGPQVGADTLSASDATNPNSVFFALSAPIFLNFFAKIINTDILASKQQISSDDASDPQRLKGMRINSLLTAQALIDLETLLYRIASEMAAEHTQEKQNDDNLNGGISTYNTAVTNNTANDQSEINTLNTATTTYNNSGKTDTDKAIYQAKIDHYNQYVSGRNSANASAASTLNSSVQTYQTNIPALNQQITAINVDRAKAGLAPLPLLTTNTPTVPTIPSMPTAPTVANPSTLPNATAPTPMGTVTVPPAPPSGTQLVAQYGLPLLNSLIPTMNAVNTFFDQLDKYLDYQRTYLGPLLGKAASAQVSYIQQNAQVFLDSGTTIGSGAGASLAAMITGLSTVSLNRLLSLSLVNDAAIQAGIVITPQQLDQLRLINLILLSQAGLAAGPQALGTLADQLAFLESTSPAFNAAIGIAFLGQVTGIASSDDLQKSILNQLIAANPTADVATLNQLASQLAAASNLALLLTGLTVLAQSLNFPTLPAQVLGLIPNPAVQTALQLSNQYTLTDVLANPFSISYLKADLSANLAGYGILSQSAADDITKNLVLTGITSEDQLKASITQQLIAKGVSTDQATALANNAANFADAEILGSNILDSAIRADTVQQSVIQGQLIEEGINATTAAQIASTAASGTYTTQRELRDELNQQLIASGIDAQEALLIATNAVVLPILETPTPTPTTPTTPANATEVGTNIAAQVLTQLSDLGAQQAQQLASSLVAALISTDPSRPLSLANLTKDQLAALEALDDTTIANAILEFQKPNFDLYSFNNRLMDPANTYSMAMWSIVNMSSTHDKRTASIDIQV